MRIQYRSCWVRGQLAGVRGQNTSEGGQVNLGPAVAVVVRAQAAAENNKNVFIVSVHPSPGGLGPVDVVEVVGEAGEARAEVRTRQQRPQPRPAPDTRALAFGSHARASWW